MKKLWDDFKDGFDEEFKKPISDETSAKALLESAVYGVTETLAHPFRWFRATWKK